MSYLDDLSMIWEQVKLSFRDRYAQSTIDLWFGDLRVQSYENNVLTLSTERELQYKIIHEKYMDMIQAGFTDLLGFQPEIQLIFTGVSSSPVPTVGRETEQRPAAEEVSKKPNGGLSDFTFEYTFENFIVGESNKFAHAACKAVALRPARDYNPLFIHGPSGLGKTHLMNAVVNEITKKNPNTRVLSVKGEEFTNQMIESLAKQEMPKFRERYRNCDILLIDDIQFIAGKTSTQEEFFHTFNALYETNKQIILTSDRPPKDISTLEERLRTRFEWGLIADIQPPDLELRIAIIKKKAEQISISIPDDVLTFLAENLRSNIRQIEGAIKKLSALTFLSGDQITMELAKNCMTELLGGAEPVNVTVDKIFHAILNKYNIPKSDLIGKKRTKEIAGARHIAIFMIRQITDMSYPSIAKIFDRDYATIHSSFELINRRYESDSRFKIEIDELRKEIQG